MELMVYKAHKDLKAHKGMMEYKVSRDLQEQMV